MPVVVQLTVDDFAKWRSVFDKNKHLRDNAGITNVQVYRHADNPKEVVVIGEAADVAKARAGLTSPEMRDGMREAGVVGPPRINWTS